MKKEKDLKVLLVDDEEDFARTLSERLHRRGVDADAVFGGQEALEFIGREAPDVMILDLKMPGLDGMEVLRRVQEEYPSIKTIILSGYPTDSNRAEASRLGAHDFLAKPADINQLTEKIRTAFTEKNRPESLYPYSRFVPILKNHLANAGISLGKNALGIKCFCRDDNQDQLGYLLMSSTGRSRGWFDLNAFGAFPAGRSTESLGPPSHHIPQVENNPWTVIFHATHVGCDSQYTLGMTDRFGMREPSSSCGLVGAILSRHEMRRQGGQPAPFRDFEMLETERALMPYLEEIFITPHPMATAAEKLFELGAAIFDKLLRTNGGRSLYIGGINVDFDAEQPENNFFIPKTLRIYEDARSRELKLQ